MRRLLTGSMAALVLATAAAASANPPPRSPATVTIGAEARRDLFVTAYPAAQRSSAFVRELREIDLPAGDVSIVVRDVPETVERESIMIRVVDGPSVEVLEQSFDYDVLSPAAMMASAEGETLTLDVSRPHSGALRSIPARLLTGPSSSAQPVWQTSEGITFAMGAERTRFGKIPARLASQPTLRWTARSAAAGKRKLELSYLMEGMHWSADYVATLSRDGRTMDLSAWVTMANKTSTAFSQTNLSVAAGTVHRAPGPFDDARPTMYNSYAAPSREELGHMHLYKVSEQTELLAHSEKNLQLLSLRSVAIRRRWEASFRIDPRDHEYAQDIDVKAVVEADNNEKSNAGVPLPRGTVRVMFPDQRGNGQLVGLSSCLDTPVGETLRVDTGPVSNVSIKLIPTSYMRKTSTEREGRYTLEVRNASAQAGTIRIDLRPGSGVQLAVTGATLTRPSAASYRIELPIRAAETRKLQMIANSERQFPPFKKAR